MTTFKTNTYYCILFNIKVIGGESASVRVTIRFNVDCILSQCRPLHGETSVNTGDIVVLWRTCGSVTEWRFHTCLECIKIVVSGGVGLRSPWVQPM